MLKGRYTALIISVIVHILLLLTLVFISAKQQKKTKKVIKKQEIQSYLYSRPSSKSVKATPVKPKPTQNNTPLIEPTKKAQKKKIESPTTIKPIEKSVQVEMPPTNIIPTNKLQKNKEPQKKVPTVNKAVPQLPSSARSSTASSRSHSLHNSLSSLRKSINQQLLNEAFQDGTQVRSASIMHGAQTPVPHSEVELTVEEKHKKNTKTNFINKWS